ncbi:hypothetical protein [Mycobacterium sp. NPDC050853]|uniref:DUF7373 family lipoprotein n=1 Tax=Mycobacterium sp. NPDC050853 TaxID=3155160 RepID=UPI0033D741F5
MKFFWLVAVLAAVSFAAPACSDASTGAPAADSTKSAPSGPLDTGTYPVTPGPALGEAGSEIIGRRIEAQRMSSAVVGPWEVDSGLNRKDMPNAVMKAEALSDVFGQEAARIAIGHGYVTGFANARSTNDSAIPHDRRLKNFVMRFPDADAATAAAPLLAAADRFGPGPLAPIALPSHPDTRAIAGASDKGKQVVAAFTGHGPFVLYQWGEASSADIAVQLVSATLDKQLPAIDAFKPTDVAKLVNLPRDPSGLVARTIGQKEQKSINSGYAYDRRGSLNFTLDPLAMAAIEDDAGVELMSGGAATVFQTKDAAAAARMVTGLVQLAAKGRPGQAGATPTDAVPNLPGSQCVADENSNTCYAAAGRDVIEAGQRDLLDAQQLAAAQYRVLQSK